MIVRVENAPGTRGFDVDSFTDLTAIALVEEPYWDAGALVLDFVSDLTDAEALSVRLRVMAGSDTEEATLVTIAAAKTANETFLTGSTITIDQLADQVDALAAQVNAIIQAVTDPES